MSHHVNAGILLTTDQRSKYLAIIKPVQVIKLLYTSGHNSVTTSNTLYAAAKVSGGQTADTTCIACLQAWPQRINHLQHALQCQHAGCPNARVPLLRVSCSM